MANLSVPGINGVRSVPTDHYLTGISNNNSIFVLLIQCCFFVSGLQETEDGRWEGCSTNTGTYPSYIMCQTRWCFFKANKTKLNNFFCASLRWISSDILTINVPFYMARDVGNDFDRGKFILRAIGRGGPWKSRPFWALKWQRVKLYEKCVRYASGTQGRSQGGCTGCTCIPPPPPPGHVHPPPAWKAGYEKRWGCGQGNKKKMQVCLPATW